MHEVETMAYSGETPWHGLGREVPKDVSADEMLVAAGLDWEVQMRTLQAVLKNGVRKTLPNQKAVVRSSDNEILSVAGKDWKPVQNRQVFEFLKEFTEAGSMTLETAGSLKGGRNVWALANLHEGFTLANGDEVKGYLLVSHPHEWGRAFKIMYTPVRVVCNNTLTFALTTVDQSAPYFTLAHNREFTDDIARLAKQTLGLASERMEQFKGMSELLTQVKYSQKEIEAYIAGLFPKRTKKDDAGLSRVGEKVISLLDNQPGGDMFPSTWWNAVNAATYYIDHHAGKERDGALQNAWFGPRATTKRKAFSDAVEFAKAA